ncbi:cytochrome c-type biogenesis protein CcmH [Candidatus Pelagibacter sp.]|nr:cytochrome c-type biogenesis protein CcmH [Candidatus Pelagibacter sp.]
MKLKKYFYIIFFIFFLNFSFAEESNLKNEITKNLRCLICQGQSVYDSDSEFAISIKNLVAEKLEDGNSEKEIYDYLKLRYGDWILYDPEFSKNTYFLWLLPLLLFLFGGAIIFKLFNIRKN